MKNKKAGFCCWCGMPLAPGEGDLMYVDEESENLGFGPMGWTGWIVFCPDRKKCKEGQKRQAEIRKEKKLATEAINAEERQLFSDGEYVQPDTSEGINLSGTVYEKKGKGHNIYGGGTRYIITHSHIWKVENNGMDGDDWSRNNIRTGGAGAIGTRFEKTETRVAFLAAHAENITEKREKEKAAEKKAEKERNEKIRAGLESMLARTPGGWDTLQAAMEKAGADRFCPKELQFPGKTFGMVNLTIREAKEYAIRKSA